MFVYSFADVRYKEFKSWHVRSSSAKETINFNKALMCFIMHGTDLYYWHQKNKRLHLVDEHASDMQTLNSDVIFYKTTREIEVEGNPVDSSTIFMIEA